MLNLQIIYVTNASFFNILKVVVLFFTLLTPPQYLVAQSYKTDTTRINNLLISAQKKRFLDTSTALADCHQAMLLAQQNSDYYWMYRAYYGVANIYRINNKVKESNAYFIKPIDFIDRLADTIKKNVYSKVGSSYMAMGDIFKAHEYYLKNYELGLRTKNISIKQISNLELGVFYKEINDYEKATQYLIQSIELSLQMNNPNEICNSYRRLAAVYLRTKNYDLALKNSEKSISYVDRIDSINLPKHYVYLSYGNVLKECQQFEKAIGIFKTALDLSEELGDKTGQIDVLLSLGDTYNTLNDLDKAAFYYKQCTALMPSMADIGLMSFQNSLGSIYIKRAEYDSAIFYLKQSLVLSEKYGKKQLVQNNYAQLADAFDKKGDASQSLFHLKKSVKLQDSIFSEENTKRIAEAQFKYNLVKSEEQVKAMKLRQGYTLGVSGLIVFVLSVGFFLYFLSAKEDKNKLLVDKNKEIQDKNRQLEESNEVLLQFAHASAHDLKEPLRNIHSFTNLIQKKYMKDLPSEANEYMEYVTGGVKKMERLLGALLEFSSVLSADKTGVKNNDLIKILDNVFAQSQDLIEAKNAFITYPSTFPKIFMSASNLEKILFNIINNALKFSENDAKIEINFEMKSDELVLSVKDQGIGIEASYGNKIFKLFQKLDRITDKESVGLGLAMCKNILDKYSGRIWFESVMNEGTTFYIAFPKSMITDVPSTNLPPQYKTRKSLEMASF
jgi:signal transduction histidine kinase